MLAALISAVLAVAPAPLNVKPRSRYILDMVHHNPGEAPTPTVYEDPATIRRMGYNGKVYFLFDSPTLAVDWQRVDPEVFPAGSEGRRWVDAKAARIDAQEAAAKRAGLTVLAQCDLVLFPKRLVERAGMAKTYGDPRDPKTERYLRLLFDQAFDRFPKLDGFVVRIGETYLQDAPFHQGDIRDRTSPERTIVPLVRILRDEICVKRRKRLVFRTWDSFDTKLEDYLKVSDAVEPHPNLAFAVKHCEGDFFRGNPFSKIIGQGRHPQIVEVQCAREYEGKGAYPNYIANGVIEGFEEHRVQMPPDALKSIGAFARTSPLYAGIWTWTRGGGWGGPYLKNELWCDLNAWVMAQWARDPSRSEASVFARYERERLGLRGGDLARFRRLALLSADAVLRIKTTTHTDQSPTWTRDASIFRPTAPKPEFWPRVLAQKAEAVAQFREIVALAKTIRFADARTADYAIVSSEYGLAFAEIAEAAFRLVHLGERGDRAALRDALAAYDRGWADMAALPARSPQCATLLKSTDEGLVRLVETCRKTAS